MSKIIRGGALLALIFAAGLLISCGSETPTASQMLSPEAITLDIGTDIRGNLVRHFTAPQAGKPPVGRPPVPLTYRFDFQEIKRDVTAEGNGVIQGDFLFSINNRPPHQGIIEVIYKPQGDNRYKIDRIQISERDINPVTLIAQITSSTTGEPLESVEVVAQRPDGLRSSRVVHTDSRGIAELEVLAGDFDLSVNHPDYQPVPRQAVHAETGQTRLPGIYLRPKKLLVTGKVEP